MSRKIEPLTPAERDWIQDQLAAARRWIDTVATGDAGGPVTLGALDRTFADWIGGGQTDAGRVQTVIEMIGAVFGEILVRNLDLHWVMATDDRGRELAVHGLPGQGDVLVFPQELVARRWEEGRRHFLLPSYQQIASHVASLRRG